MDEVVRICLANPDSGVMFFDLNVPLPTPALISTQQAKKGKGKQKTADNSLATSDTLMQCWFSSGQIIAIEAKIDILAHCKRCLHVIYYSFI